MKRITAIAVLLLFTPNASAALLMEIENTANFLPNEINATFGTGRHPHPEGAAIGICCVNPLLTHTDTATPEELARMQAYFANGEYEFYVGVNGATGWYRIDNLWTAGQIQAVYPNAGAFVTPHATPRGSGLSGYTLTEITTQTFPLFQNGQPISMEQITRIYGEAVPEPATWLLVAFAFTTFALRRVQR